MNESQKQKLFDICKRSKRGFHVSEAEHEWARKMFEKYETEYCEIQKKAEKQAVAEFLGPFGP